MSTFTVVTTDGPRTVEAKDVQMVQGTEDGGFLVLRHRALGATEDVKFTEPFATVRQRLHDRLEADYRATRKEQIREQEG